VGLWSAAISDQEGLGQACVAYPRFARSRTAPVKFEEGPLPTGKATHLHRVGVSIPIRSRDGRWATGEMMEPPIILEADKSSVKEVVDTGRQQLAVLAVQPLFVR
jgi:hypothetical protein